MQNPVGPPQQDKKVRRRTHLRYTTPWQAILRAAGEFYKERAGGSGFVSLRRDKAYLRTRSGFVHYAVTSRTVRRYTTPWQAILRAAGEFYKERAEGSGFVSLRRDKAYLCTRSGFVSLRRDKPNGSPLHNAMASNIASSWRVLQGKSRGSVPSYSTEAKDAVRLARCRKIACLKYGIRR